MDIKNNIVLILFVTLLSTLITIPVIGQGSDNISDEDFENLLQGSVIPLRDYTETEGSPYFNQSFQSGSITFSSGSTRDDVSFKYNTYEDRLEISFQNRVFAISADQIDRFHINMDGKQYEFQKGFDSRGLDREDFVLILSDGPVKGLLKLDTSFQQAMASYGTATQQDEYISDKTLYVHREGDTERVRRLRVRNVLRELDSHQDELENYINRNDLNLENTDHLVDLFDYYNRLINS